MNTCKCGIPREKCDYHNARGMRGLPEEGQWVRYGSRDAFKGIAYTRTEKRNWRLTVWEFPSGAARFKAHHYTRYSFGIHGYDGDAVQYTGWRASKEEAMEAALEIWRSHGCV